MSLNWVDVADTMVKIGFGSIITAVSGYAVLKRTQSHDVEKEVRNKFYNAQDVRKDKYVEFLAQTQTMVQKYLFSHCSCQESDYTDLLRIYNEVQIISCNDVRIKAFELINAVNEIIMFNSPDEHELKIKLRKNVNDATAHFQCVAQIDVTANFSMAKT
ncbi:hypothetical protein LMH66_10870 [Shewanella sp. 10N.7]|uniref:hypothetical protein n=1 Tax=Shewanella sp. 10N.7 TaxID=2885093 RepID=UPI001E5A4D8D|nr:hypothetical protein [Shewanella sp. 10N.7]MCC4833132.1 hypothetical protein [Shewanella sp. 10N.7]